MGGQGIRSGELTKQTFLLPTEAPKESFTKEIEKKFSERLFHHFQQTDFNEFKVVKKLINHLIKDPHYAVCYPTGSLQNLKI